jgi:hypothetical protein
MRYQTKINLLTRIWFAVTVAAGVFLALSLPKGALRIALPAAWVLLATCALTIAATAVTQAQTRALLPVLIDACDADRFIGEVYGCIAPKQSARPPFLWAMLLYDGRYAAGQYGDALRGLNEISLKGSGRIYRQHRAMWLLNLAEISRALTRFEDAENALGECQSIIRRADFPKNPGEILLRGCELERCALHIQQGCLEGAEETMRTQLAETKHEYDRVNAQHWLAEIFERQGEADKAREAREYVAAHGNTLYYAALARERLGIPAAPGIARLWHQQKT